MFITKQVILKRHLINKNYYEKRSHIIQSIHNFKDIENQVNLDINRIARNNFQLIKPKVTCFIINDNNDQLISSIKKEMKIFDEIIVANIQKE